MKCFSMIVLPLIVLLVGCRPSYVHEQDPEYDAANRAMESNDKKARQIMDAYVALQMDRVKVGEISRARANAMIRLKVAEVAAEMDKANKQIADDYKRSKSTGRSLTCMTTASYNSAFTTCE